MEKVYASHTHVFEKLGEEKNFKHPGCWQVLLSASAFGLCFSTRDCSAYAYMWLMTSFAVSALHFQIFDLPANKTTRLFSSQDLSGHKPARLLSQQGIGQKAFTAKSTEILPKPTLVGRPDRESNTERVYVQASSKAHVCSKFDSFTRVASQGSPTEQSLLKLESFRISNSNHELRSTWTPGKYQLELPRSMQANWLI